MGQGAIGRVGALTSSDAGASLGTSLRTQMGPLSLPLLPLLLILLLVGLVVLVDEGHEGLDVGGARGALPRLLHHPLEGCPAPQQSTGTRVASRRRRCSSEQQQTWQGTGFQLASNSDRAKEGTRALSQVSDTSYMPSSSLPSDILHSLGQVPVS